MSYRPTVSAGYKEWRKSKKCNGCGSGWNAYLVPNRIYGLNIKDCCCPHDYEYEIGITLEDKDRADKNFKLNMYAKIEADKNWFRNNKFIKKRMKKRADLYYDVVVKHGEYAFFDKDEK